MRVNNRVLYIDSFRIGLSDPNQVSLINNRTGDRFLARSIDIENGKLLYLVTPVGIPDIASWKEHKKSYSEIMKPLMKISFIAFQSHEDKFTRINHTRMMEELCQKVQN
jgi:hypothetical protein